MKKQQRNKEQTEDEVDLTRQEHNRALKVHYKSCITFGLSKVGING